MNPIDSLLIHSLKRDFSHYALAAIIPLRTALFNHDYDFWHFKDRFGFSGMDHEDDIILSDFMKKLNYDGSDYFTADELRFVMHMSGFYRLDVSDEQIELDRQELRSMEGTALIVKAARYMLKTIDFYQYRYKPNRTEWHRKHQVGVEMCKLRGKLFTFKVIEPANDIETDEDDSYFTDEDQEGG